MRKILLLVLILFPSLSQAQDWQAEFITALKNGGAYVENSSGKVLFSYRIDDYFVPASTIKVATAAAALHTFGKNYRFPTDFYYISKGKKLIVKGYGDPMLVSEEFPTIANQIKNKGIHKITGIILDTSHFAPGVVIDGVSHSANPYDALNGALLANFNTINVRKSADGSVVSGEPQTPITPIAQQMGKNLKTGKQRINLGKDRTLAVKYVGELLTAFLQKEGIEVSGDILIGKVPSNAKLIYRHESSKSLENVLVDLLDFSTNFSSNQLFLAMGAKKYGEPATVDKGLKVLREFLRNEIGWKNFQIAEGAGLSRKNQVTPRQMMELLKYFEPYRNLLPLKDGVFRAKTGTLKDANTYVGYFPLQGRQIRFVILVNSVVPYNYKFKLAKMLYAGLNGSTH